VVPLSGEGRFEDGGEPLSGEGRFDDGGEPAAVGERLEEFEESDELGEPDEDNSGNCGFVTLVLQALRSERLRAKAASTVVTLSIFIVKS
jgi:hypothetical protein